ncbi:MAG: YcgL domain-containing protein [Succinatimonas sp.]|nr:YcgL domain-containing protein [Succinatimonas sp.]
MSERLVFVYKSASKPRHYLYLAQKDIFSDVPTGLLNAFGVPKFMMMFSLSKHKNLPKVSYEKLEEALATKGYFLRIDLESEEENLINQERIYNGLKPLSKEELTELFK